MRSRFSKKRHRKSYFQSSRGESRKNSSPATGRSRNVCLLSSPRNVGRLWLFLFADPLLIVTTLSLPMPTSNVVVRCQPWFYLRLVAYSFFRLSEGAYGLPRDWWCSQHTLRLNGVMDTHPRPERRKNRNHRPK